MTISAAKYAEGANPDDAAIKSYYDAHKAEYMTPETVDLRYAEVSLAQLASKVAVNDAQLKAYYDEQKAKTPERFAQAEQRRVRHILLAVNDPKEDAAVKTKAEGILDPKKRSEVVEQLEKIMQEDGPLIQPAWHTNFTFYDKRVQGFRLHPTNYIFGEELAISA